MMRNRLTIRTSGAGRGALRVALALAAVGALLSGCGGGSMFGGGSSDPSPSLGDRFGQLFGSKSQAVGEQAPAAGGQ